MALSIPWLQRYVDIIAFSIVIHVGFSITIIFHYIPLQRTVLTAVLFLCNQGGGSDFTTRRQKNSKRKTYWAPVCWKQEKSIQKNRGDNQAKLRK